MYVLMEELALLTEFKVVFCSSGDTKIFHYQTFILPQVCVRLSPKEEQVSNIIRVPLASLFLFIQWRKERDTSNKVQESEARETEKGTQHKSIQPLNSNISIKHSFNIY